ncbi:MAG: hypothetical protein D6766_07955 [Verrucomicrobia bacterium]|nr:MAG: hypothetical protein D6766_07955 [Verrucomicrobiota bacterium]
MPGGGSGKRWSRLRGRSISRPSWRKASDVPGCTTSDPPAGGGGPGENALVPLDARLRERIRREGPLRWDQFMEAALYTPGIGYYEREPGHVGRAGDFYTAVSVGAVFGRLLAVALTALLDRLGRGSEPVWLIEAGAHDGRLAADVLGWVAEQRPDLMPGLRYGVVEPSLRRRGWQAARLARWADRVEWFDSLAELAAVAPRGVLFANELLDALPVRRLGWDAARRCWREWHVALGEGADVERFEWRLGGEPWQPRPEDQALLAGAADPDGPLAAAFPDGLVWEHPEAALDWWRQAAGALREGWLLTLDYGDWHGGGPRPHRPQGTLRAFRRQRQEPDLLAAPGEQDLTADVDFALIRRAGEAAGMVTEVAEPQGEWLTRLAGTPAGRREAEGWDARQRRQFLTLVHPEHMGRRFQVLLQRRMGTG